MLLRILFRLLRFIQSVLHRKGDRITVQKELILMDWTTNTKKDEYLEFLTKYKEAIIYVTNPAEKNMHNRIQVNAAKCRVAAENFRFSLHHQSRRRRRYCRWDEYKNDKNWELQLRCNSNALPEANRTWNSCSGRESERGKRGKLRIYTRIRCKERTA